MIAVLAVMSALLIVGKWSLNLIPNVEVVTLFCGLFGYTFGFISVIPTCIFCLEETLAYGIHTWVIDYFVHWNVVTVIFAVLGKLRREPMRKFEYVLPTVCAVATTAIYGVFTSAVDAVFACIYSEWSKFFYYFGVIYVRGIYLYIIHVVCNLILFSTLFYPLSLLIFKLKKQMFKNVERSP